MENFRELRTFWKVSPVFPVGLFQTESCSISSKPSLILVSDFRSLFSLNGTPFAPVENAIPRRNLSVLNFSYHLPKPLIDQFDHVNVIRNNQYRPYFLKFFFFFSLSSSPGYLSKNDITLSSSVTCMCSTLKAFSYNLTTTSGRLKV